MIHSVITINNYFKDKSEMLIPECIGSVQAGHCSRKRLDKALTPGNRKRGFEEQEEVEI